MGCIVHKVTESDMTEWLSLSLSGPYSSSLGGEGKYIRFIKYMYIKCIYICIYIYIMCVYICIRFIKVGYMQIPTPTSLNNVLYTL